MVIQELYEQSIKLNEKLALKSEKNNYSYSQVEEMTNYVSSVIEDKVGKNNRIVVKLNHSLESILVMLSIIKSNNTFVPVNNEVDSDRLNFIVKSTLSKMIITDGDESGLEDDKVLHLNVNQLINKEKTKKENNYLYSLNNEVYIMHTSGTTGNPKGVIVSQKNLNYILKNIQNISPVNEKSTYLFSTPYIFDVSVTEMLGWIKGGGSVYCLDLNNVKNYKRFSNIIKEQKITHFATSPSAFTNLIHTFNLNDILNLKQDLKYVVVAGEKFNPLIHKFYIDNKMEFTLINAYGPTEATIYASYYILPQYLVEEIPIGKKLHGVSLKVVPDRKGRMFISGDGVALGYTDLELTKKSFITIDKKRFYDTGDIVEVKNELIYYHGREDSQVQINGIRVELGEIEYYLEKNYELSHCKVIYHKNKLIAFITTSLDVELIKEGCHLGMPRHLIPHKFIKVAEFPLTPNRKIDTNKLLNKCINDPIKKISGTNNTHTNILNDIAELMELPPDEIQLEDDIFELGADSLTVFRLILILEAYFNKEIEMELIYSFRKIGDIFNAIENSFFVGLKEKTNEILNVKDKKNIEGKIREYIYQNIIIKDYFDTIHSQRVYFYDNFESVLSSSYAVSSVEEAYHFIEILIDNNEIMKARLQEENDKLIFEIALDVSNIPVINLDNNLNSWIKYIEDLGSELLKESRKFNGLLCVPLIVTQNTETKIVFVLDHSIADLRVLNILREQISLLALGKTLNESESYKVYCEKVRKNNTQEKIETNAYHKELLRISSLLNSDWVDNYKYQISYLEKTSPNFKKNYEYIIYVGFLVSELLFRQSNERYLVISTIYNARAFENSEFQYTIGTLHSSRYLIFKEGDDFEEYFNRNILQFTSSEEEDIFYRPGYIFNSNYPQRTEYQSNLRNKLKGISIISLNFLGVLSAQEKIKYFNSLEKVYQELSNNNSNKIFVNAFMDKSKIFLQSNRNLFD